MNIKIEKTVLFQELKNLLIAAYYLGQDAGLRGKKFNHTDCLAERESIVELLLSDQLKQLK